MLTKIIESYKLADEFCELMEYCKNNNIYYNDTEKDFKYQKHKKRTKENMTNNPKSMIVGSLTYLVRHPKKMISAQKYYNSDFEKPCSLK